MAAPSDVPPGLSAPAADVVSAVFHGVAVSQVMAVLVVEFGPGAARVRWCNERAVQLLGYALEDLRSLTLGQLLPSMRGGEFKLLLRRERAVQMTLPARTASGALVEVVVASSPAPTSGVWTLRVTAAANEQERALRATADVHERRFATLTERSPVPTLLSEQGMRLAHVNDAFCSLVGQPAEHLLGTGWMGAVHPADLDAVIEQAAAVLEGGEGEA